MTTIVQRRAADTATDRTPSAAYERDFFAWTQDQAAKLRARTAETGDVDWENVAEEIEGVGISEKREVRSRLEVLIVHLLKWQFQPDRRKHEWSDTITEQRRRLSMVIDDSPSLRTFPAAILADLYDLAVMSATKETQMPRSVFPATCPFGIEEILDPEFLPEAA
ncbi:DUF29 domain-containing protein [Aureimonas pseudogalii]|uniref:DUF29 domain-containing protein n=1 Tax=Aureimonas pseudogalii TaxID=1744844 RepID=A0A7W6E9S4_9HYPH|nr:DUF29 domain-containing protein [Aureimonas pseudogalii]MBB3997371.1 hypothetical protein [Aureimonas pseudogalii]